MTKDQRSETYERGSFKSLLEAACMQQPRSVESSYLFPPHEWIVARFSRFVEHAEGDEPEPPRLLTTESVSDEG
ncbi:Uncharacterized protein TCM_034065 [Theobroma cacao]|uniref:Uncharacterized protein n=1 Tax=Theobroma cacao TaxID=3641 RepID=A0A061FJX7_THECC|nr:Uncharacterized protein TCM_034065 [Theobroma cacao]